MGGGAAPSSVWMSMCLSFTPPLSATTAAASATAAAGIAAAPSLARRRYLLGQVRSKPGRAGESREALDHRSQSPTGSFPSGRRWPGGSMCLLGLLPASVGKPPLHPITIAYTAYRCPRVKTHHSPRLAAPRDQERAGAGHAVGSGGCTASRAWHRQMQLRRKPRLRLSTTGGEERSSPLQAR